MYDVLGDKPVDQEALHRRTREAVAEIVQRQRTIGIDAISDGEMGKVGFSNYVMQHLGWVRRREPGAAGGSCRRA